MGKEKMNEEALRQFLKRGRRSASAIKRVVTFVQAFEAYLREKRGGRALDEAEPADLRAFVDWVEREPNSSANTHLWALRYYFEFTSNEELRSLVCALRQQRIKRQPFVLGKFRGVDADHVARLAAAGIVDVEQMLQAGRTPQGRQALAEKMGIPLEAILEFVKLSDLARVGGVKSIRARLYHDAGVDTLEKMARWDPAELRAMLIEFVERTGFDGIAPLPKEARSAVETAQRLPKILEW